MIFDNEQFRAAIQGYIAHNQITDREAARESGVSPSTMSRILRGDLPDIERFAILVRWMDADANLFVDRAIRGATTTIREIDADEEKWTRLYHALDVLDVPEDLIKAIIVLVKVVRKENR